MVSGNLEHPQCAGYSGLCGGVGIPRVHVLPDGPFVKTRQLKIVRQGFVATGKAFNLVCPHQCLLPKRMRVHRLDREIFGILNDDLMLL
jgi:hypothetical protein